MNRVLLLFLAGLASTSPAAAIPPAIPPSGPISWTLDCLFENVNGPYAANFSFREDAPLKESVPMFGERDAFQAHFQQFPFNSEEVDSVNFEADGNIVIYTAKRAVVGRFAPVVRAPGERGHWMSFSTVNSEGSPQNHGHCLASITGRTVRPINLTRLHFFRIDRVEP